MKLKAVKSKQLSSYGDPRFVLVNEETGEIVDDAQGYGYKSAQNAYAAGAYKFRDKSKDKEKAKKERAVAAWMKEHQDFVELMDVVSFETLKGCYGPEEEFNIQTVKQLLEENHHTDLPFSAKDLYWYWIRGPKYTKRRK